LKPIEAPSLAEIRAARERLRGVALRTPLVPLEVAGAACSIWLKLENLQPIGSFKIRGAGNAVALLGAEALREGVVTASAGNMAQGVAWSARRLGVPCRVVVPDNAPRTKIAAIERLGAQAIAVPFDDWWRAIATHECPGVPGVFVHPVSDRNVIAGHGTIGIEILEDLADVDTVVVPFGGGGLSSGIAAAVTALQPAVRVYGAEVDAAAPLAASLAAGEPRQVDYTPSFVDGIGGKGMLPEMWPLVRKLLAGSLTSSVAEIAEAVRLLAERARVVAEGAGAASLAPVLAGRAEGGKVVCVISGGNIDGAKLARILSGGVP
jgi:threonine dehydratase